jgi:hypothetical protein
MFFTSREYVVWVEFFFQCVSLIELKSMGGWMTYFHKSFTLKKKEIDKKKEDKQ